MRASYLQPSSLQYSSFLRKEGAKQAALILMKNSHFNRTPLYLVLGILHCISLPVVLPCSTMPNLFIYPQGIWPTPWTRSSKPPSPNLSLQSDWHYKASTYQLLLFWLWTSQNHPLLGWSSKSGNNSFHAWNYETFFSRNSKKNNFWQVTWHKYFDPGQPNGCPHQSYMF